MTANVLVVFGPPTEELESVAAAAAVGAVQSRAHIRLRRLGGVPGEERIVETYVRPRPDDVAWADGVVLVTGAGNGWNSFLGLFSSRRVPIGAVLSKDAEPVPLRRAWERIGGRVLDTAEAFARKDRSLANAALLVGRWVGLSARSGAGTPAFDEAARLLGPEHEHG